jgi:hypothetical protein
MQFPVPQFTDVEDKIIGPLSLKQFGFIFIAGMIVVVTYTSTKSVMAAIVAFVLFGVPALGIAFAKINGRPIYNLFPVILKFIASDKLLVFYKEASSGDKRLKNAEMQSATKPATEVAANEKPPMSLAQVKELLAKEVEEESELVKQLKG